MSSQTTMATRSSCLLLQLMPRRLHLKWSLEWVALCTLPQRAASSSSSSIRLRWTNCQPRCPSPTTVRACEAGGALSDTDKADIARAFETAVVDTLVIKCRRALKHENLTRLVMAGGVSANLRLRAALEEKLGKERCEVFYPAPKLCTDNGAMIAYAGALRLAAGECDGPDAEVRPRWPMTELTAPQAA